MNRRDVIAGAATAGSTALVGCLGELGGTPVSESFSESYAVSAETRVLISNRNGPVSVQRSGGEQLTVSGQKQADSQDGLDSITVDVVEGERFGINVRFSTGSGFSNRQMDLSVGTPEGVAVDTANTTNGDVTVTGVRDDLTAATVNGDVELTDVSGFVRGDTSNGNARVEGVSATTDTDRRGYITGHLRGGTSPLLSVGSNNGDVRLVPA